MSRKAVLAAPMPDATRARTLPLIVAVVGLLLSALLGGVLRRDDDDHRAQVMAAEAAAIERTLRLGLEQRALALMRMARRWQLAGGRAREEFDLEASVNIESYPAFRAIGWVDPDLVVRWVYPTPGNEAAIGFDNRREPQRHASVLAAQRRGRIAVAGPVDLAQGGRALLWFQPIGPVGGRPQGFIYAAVDPATVLQRSVGDTAQAYALRVSVRGEPIYRRAVPSDASVERSFDFAFGGMPWRVELWAPPNRVGLAEVVPALAALLSLLLAAGTQVALSSQQRALTLRQEIRAGEDRFQALLENSPRIMWVNRPDGSVEYFNRAWRDYTGQSKQISPTAWLGAVHPDDLPQVQAIRAQGVAAAEPYSIELRLRRADGVYRSHDGRVAPLLRDGRVFAWVGTATDIDEIRHAEAALRESEGRFRTLAEAMPALVYMARDQRNIYINDRYAEYAGLPAAELMGDGWRRVLHPEDAEALANGSSGREAGSLERELRLRRADGVWRWHLVRGVPHPSDAALWIGAMIDIHDRHEAETALRESEARLRLAAEVAGFGTFDYDLRNDRHVWSPETYRIYGLEPGAAVRVDQLNELIHPDDRADADAALAAATARGDPHLSVEYRIVQPDGAVRHVALRSRIDYSTENERQVPVRIVGAVRDVTTARRAEAELRESEALLRAVLEALPVGVIIADADGRIVRDNAANRELWGVPPDTANWQQYGEWVGFHPETGKRIEAEEWAMARALLTGEVVRNELVQNQRFGTGERRYYLNNAAPVRDAAGNIVAGVVAELDVTERLAAEEEVRRLNRDLERRVEERTRRLAEVNAELQAFAYSVSHDLRAPLRAMQGFSQALIEDYGGRLDELGRDYIGRISSGAKQMDALIQDLLAYSRLTREEIVTAPVPLERVVEAALMQLRAVLRDAGAEVAVEPPLPVVRGQATILTQAIANLVANAAKFVAPGVKPLIRIHAETRGERVRLWVEDNGIGIAPEHRSKIFEVFQRLHGMTQYSGTGIGLAIVKKGVERLAGEVGVESQPENGSRFWIELPQG